MTGMKSYDGSMRRPALALAALLCAACTGPDVPTTLAPVALTPPPAPVAQPLEVLVLTATAGFRHDAIPTARLVLGQIADRTREFNVTATETLGDITAARLAATNVLFFALTSGELAFSDPQKAAIMAFVEEGGGFIGAHSAADTLYTWPDYGRLVGAYFKEHPWIQEATVAVENRAHQATRDLGGSFRLLDEFYTFRDNPRGRVDVLLSLDAPSVGTQGDFPLAWSQSFGRGRSFYTALGHFESTWTDARFQAHLLGAIRWAGGT
jgi:type 1 glutamine amidotransferase